MNASTTRFIKTVGKWGIALAGIAWVIGNISFRDTILVLNEQNVPQKEIVVSKETDGSFLTLSPQSNTTHRVSPDQVVIPPQQAKVTVLDAAPNSSPVRDLLGIKNDPSATSGEMLLLVRNPVSQTGEWLPSSRVAEKFAGPRNDEVLQPGVITLGKQARWSYISLAFALFPITYVLVSLRWLWLLRAVGIQMNIGRAIVLSAIGSFYNTFLPGSNGGDVVRAFQASRETRQPVAATVSVILDRVVGLLSLVVLASVSSAVVLTMETKVDAAHRECTHIFWTCTLITAFAVGSFFFAVKLPLERLVTRFAPKRFTQQTDPSLGATQTSALVSRTKELLKVLDVYRRSPRALILAFLGAIPAHLVLTACAIALAFAFNLNVPMGYFLVVVPIIVLVGALPLSPQGVGVQEVVAAILFASYSVPLSQVIAFTMSLRLVQVGWYLIGGLLVTSLSKSPSTQPEESVEVQMAM